MNNTKVADFNPPSLFERDKAITELTEKLDEFLETFYEKGVA